MQMFKGLFNKQQIDKIRIPLFWKFTIGMVIVVVLFGSINVILVHRIIFTSLEDELKQKGVFMSQIISQRAINYILFDDLVAMNVLLEEVKAADETIAYIMICDPDCNIRAHTFDGFVPDGLPNLYERTSRTEILSAHVRFRDSDQLIRDISIPLIEGSIGFLRVGLVEDNISQTLDKATTALLGMIMILVLISLVGTFIFSYLVTSPVKAISDIADNLDMQSIREKNIQFASRYPSPFRRIMGKLPGDEIDILVSRFNDMVSRLQDAYDELETAQKKLIQSEKLASIGTLAAGVAHEVNNPLAGIMHSISRIRKHPDKKEETDKYLDLMQEAAIKMEKVVKNLLNFARQPDQRKEVFNLREALHRSVSLAKHRFEKENIEVTKEKLPEGIECIGNANQLEQVFLNILINSIDAIMEKKTADPMHKGQINIGFEDMSFIQDHIRLEFADNGVGIPEENLSKVFDPFFTTKPPGKGTGLGLAVCLNIVREHGGDMEIKNNSYSGSSVIITFPIIHRNR